MSQLLSVRNLVVEIEDKEVISGLDLEIKEGEVHAIMGPNGSGKSSLCYALAGKSDYEVKSGEVRFADNDLLDLEPEERAHLGLFLAFQYPTELPGIKMSTFLRESAKVREKGNFNSLRTLSVIKEKMKELNIEESFLRRDVNYGFSGGEKKRNEMLQLRVLGARLAILDETDSGLDIDALKDVTGAINSFVSAGGSVLLVTHYKRILNYIRPDVVHVMVEGSIAKSSSLELADELEKHGYGQYASR